MKKNRPTYKPEFRLECAMLVTDNNYTIREAANAMGVGKSSINKWVKQLRDERKGISNRPSALTPDQREIQELKKIIKRIELEKSILKKATALLMSDSLDDVR